MPVIHNPFDTEDLINCRKAQEDPIVQYYIVNKDLNMSAGKIGAQIAHGAAMFSFFISEDINNHDSGMPFELLPEEVQLTIKWLASSFRKVVLSGNQKDFEKIKEQLPVFLVKDAGLTEVDPGSETVLVTYPMYKSKRPKLLTRLRVLV
jgi:PTH2 family peptidyl-tRNA hydrolase